MKINLNTTDMEQLGEQLMKYGYSVATRKGLTGASLDDAAISFATGAWEAYRKLDPEKMNGGSGLGYVYRGGMNSLIQSVRKMRNRSDYAAQAHEDKTAKAKTLAGDYAPADLGDEGEGASLWDMLADPKAEAPDRRPTDSEQLARALGAMTSRETRLMTAYAEGATLREIGKAEGISAEAVRKILNNARERVTA